MQRYTTTIAQVFAEKKIKVNKMFVEYVKMYPSDGMDMNVTQ